MTDRRTDLADQLRQYGALSQAELDVGKAVVLQSAARSQPPLASSALSRARAGRPIQKWLSRITKLLASRSPTR